MIQKCLTISSTLLLISITHASEFDIYCDFFAGGNLLDCSDINTFPQGSFEGIETIIFSGNNFTELKPYVFHDNNFYNLKRALLRSNNINYIHPNAFGMMPSVIFLDLSHNHLVSLHKNSFSGLDSLKYLHLASNGLVTINPEVIRSLTALHTLDLSHNSIVKLERNFLEQKPISYLDLSHNPIGFNEEEVILESSSLSELNLQGCKLKKLATKAFSKVLKLNFLDLSRNALQTIPAGVFERLENLTYLDISYNLISDLDVDTVFSSLPNLDVLYCQNNLLDNEINCTQIAASTYNTDNGTEEADQWSNQVLEVNETESTATSSIRNNYGGQILNNRLQNSKKNEIEGYENSTELDVLLVKLLLGSAIICIVLVVVLVSMVLYVIRKSREPAQNVYSEIA